MLRSDRPPNPQHPQDRDRDPPPNPDTRYAPTTSVRLDMVDVDGQPIVVVLSRDTAQVLADRLFAVLNTIPMEGRIA